ncbi:uncharacterized protein PAC_18870 [Phialocephala subalpina]|uniref:Uncharacterized protein n=1 Tax=Phialocephala subalpina TaxID=576137 RepID=A0A1L7XVD8_9HELO|nr:uncharacterized protein PAC_18870 [Phialocephala subalpina]
MDSRTGLAKNQMACMPKLDALDPGMSVPGTKHHVTMVYCIQTLACASFVIGVPALMAFSTRCCFIRFEFHVGFVWKNTESSIQRIAPSAYRKLQSQEIRNLVLAPGSGTDVLHGRLVTRNLQYYVETLKNGTTDEDEESFEALSYCWETPIRDYPFQTEDGIVRITGSLRLAL